MFSSDAKQKNSPEASLIDRLQFESGWVGVNEACNFRYNISNFEREHHNQHKNAVRNVALVNQKTVSLEFKALYTILEISLLNSIEDLYFLNASKFLLKSWKKVCQWPALNTNPLKFCTEYRI